MRRRFADSDELIALAQAAAESGGVYVAHMRSEADRFLEALDEMIAIGRATGQRAEVYHLKAAGEKNWPKMAQVIAQDRGGPRRRRAVSADMYAYTAGATGLDCEHAAVGAGGWARRDDRAAARIPRSASA